MVKRVLVAFDFDHTLISKNSDTYVLRLLPDGTDLPLSIKKLYTTAGWNDYQREVFRYLHSHHVTKEQLLACIAEIQLIEGMRELLEYFVTSTMMAAELEVQTESKMDAELNAVADAVINDAETGPVSVEGNLTTSTASPVFHHTDGRNWSCSPIQFDAIIVSDANSVIIDHILETMGLQSMFSKVYTNPASFDNSGCLQLFPYHRQDWCNMSSVNMCKGHILDEHCQKSGVKYDVVAYVGDGTNDLCPAVRLRATDIVFPRRRFSLDKRISEDRSKVAAMVRCWDTGFDIMSALKEVLVEH